MTANNKAEGFSLQDWEDTNIKAYNRYEEYNENIRPLVDALHAECAARGFPISGRVCHAQKANGDNSCHEFVNIPSLDVTPAEILVVPVVKGINPGSAVVMAALVDCDRARIQRANAISRCGTIEA